MENKEPKKNVPEELDDNILDHVSGGKQEFIREEEIGVFCKTCKKPFTVNVSKMYDECPTCRDPLNKLKAQSNEKKDMDINTDNKLTIIL